MIRVQTFKITDFEILGDKTHRSISGGIATHSFEELDTFKVETIEEALKKIESTYGKLPYIFDDRLELQLNDSETLSFYLDRISVERVDVNELRNDFNLEWLP